MATAAGAQTVHQQGYWTRAYLRLKVSPHWTWHSEVDERRFVNPDQQWQFITHQHVHYRLTPTLDAGVGGTYSRQSQSTVTIPEYRLFGETSWTIPLSAAVRLQQKLRVEQRWIQQVRDRHLIDDYTTPVRFRYRVQGEWQPHPRWRLRLFDEFMVSMHDFDQNRLYAGAEYQLGTGFAAELGYMKLWQNRLLRPDNYNRDVLRFTLYKDVTLLTAR
ncbi:DUF2490 domain-containing protein [Hymenobacter defluvii]|uniref:DUF2490 domain-containing protein n=1 Tax=Hymenobacter defluvii TaxID=2054411 RepID=A0ABS3T9N6_9BACT|nr:DUF2490 domain-containing protein [Hymenobacter defluvii]MBO3270370.1 DUF2490 domain-containing protein [Hymenobacter defluvii]